MLTAVRDIVHPYIGYMHTSITRAVRPGVNGRGSSDAGACSKPRMMVHVGDKTHACMHADTLCAYGKQYDYPAKWKREHIRIQSLARGRDRTVKESWHARHGQAGFCSCDCRSQNKLPLVDVSSAWTIGGYGSLYNPELIRQ